MQATHTFTADQRAAAQPSLAQRRDEVVGGPTPISPELLQFVGGGKGSSTPVSATAAPNNGWR